MLNASEEHSSAQPRDLRPFYRPGLAATLRKNPCRASGLLWALAIVLLGACSDTRTVDRFCEVDCVDEWEKECVAVCGISDNRASASTGGTSKPAKGDAAANAIEGEEDGGIGGGADARVDSGDMMVSGSGGSARPPATDAAMCPSDCPDARCDEGSGECRPCEDNDDCAEPQAVCLAGSCVACASGMDCLDEQLSVCEPEGNTCVQCFEHSDCADPAKPHCLGNRCEPCNSNDDCHDPALPQCSEGTCVGCDDSAQCAHFPLGQRACDFDSGSCVQCTGLEPEACKGNVCDALQNTCTKIEPRSAEQCASCVSDAQCKPGQRCVMETFGEGKVQTDVGFVCLFERPINELCNSRRPYIKKVTERSIDGIESDMCHLSGTTCGSLGDYGKPCTDDAGVPDDEACGEEGLEDGFCVLAEQGTTSEAYKCTFSCNGEDLECPGSKTCSQSAPFKCDI